MEWDWSQMKDLFTNITFFRSVGMSQSHIWRFIRLEVTLKWRCMSQNYKVSENQWKLYFSFFHFSTLWFLSPFLKPLILFPPPLPAGGYATIYRPEIHTTLWQSIRPSIRLSVSFDLFHNLQSRALPSTGVICWIFVTKVTIIALNTFGKQFDFGLDWEGMFFRCCFMEK